MNNKNSISITLIATLILSLLIATPSMALRNQDTTSNWTREHVSKIEMNKDNTAPKLNGDELEKITPDLHVWDTWPLRNRDGSIATINGYKIIFSLTAPSDLLPGKRHDVAEIRYFYSKDGKDWKLGGKVFNEGEALGTRQWAGSSMYDNGKLHMFYTATGRKNDDKLTYEQRLATSSADLVVNKDGIEFRNWSPHKIMLEPDGEYYQTREQALSGEGGYAFRDPWYYKDSKTGEEYILFEANSAGTLEERELKDEYIGSDEYSQDNDIPEGAKRANGSVGIAKINNGDFTNLTTLPPILESNYVNEELERPHIVNKGNKYYLFVDTHISKYAEGITGPEGLYGFVSDSLHGEYKPLNDSGLVLANPTDNPYQAYSWVVMPNGKVISFLNYYDLDGLSVSEIGNMSSEYQFNHFGGTLAKTLKLSIRGDRTKVITDLQQGRIK